MASSAIDTRLDLTVIDNLWVVKISKAWLALTTPELLAALKRGKRLRRRLAFRARHEEDT
jgi:hypothetical protein